MSLKLWLINFNTKIPPKNIKQLTPPISRMAIEVRLTLRGHVLQNNFRVTGILEFEEKSANMLEDKQKHCS